jgi:hypothetical protein
LPEENTSLEIGSGIPADKFAENFFKFEIKNSLN